MFKKNIFIKFIITLVIIFGYFHKLNAYQIYLPFRNITEPSKMAIFHNIGNKHWEKLPNQYIDYNNKVFVATVDKTDTSYALFYDKGYYVPTRTGFGFGVNTDSIYIYAKDNKKYLDIYFDNGTTNRVMVEIFKNGGNKIEDVFSGEGDGSKGRYKITKDITNYSAGSYIVKMHEKTGVKDHWALFINWGQSDIWEARGQVQIELNK